MNTIFDADADARAQEKRHPVLQCEDCGSYDIERSRYQRQNPNGTWPTEWLDDPTEKCAECGSTIIATVYLSDLDIKE